MQLDLALEDVTEPAPRPARSRARPGRMLVTPTSQPLLPGLEIKRLDNLFFAIQLPLSVATAVAGLRSDLMRDFGMHGNPVRESCLHISVYPFGLRDGVSAEVEAKAIEAAEALSAPSFDVEFTRALSFGKARDNFPLVLRATDGLDRLYDFHHALGEQMRKVGLARYVGKSFTPHITLLYSPRILPERAVTPIGWRVRGFALINSTYGSSTHKPVREWSFSD